MTPEEPVLKRSCRASHYEHVADRVSELDVQSNVRDSRLSTVASAAASKAQAIAPTHHFAVETDGTIPQQQVPAGEFEDAKFETRVQMSRSFSEGQLDTLVVRPERLQAGDSALESSLKVRLETSEHACEVLRSENESLKAENAILREGLQTLKRKIRVLAQTRVPAGAFGPAAWSQYFGEVGTVPPLPANIARILNDPCPFWAGRCVRDTHLLVLIPSSVDGRDFSLDLLGELIQSPKGGGYPTRFRVYDGNVQEVLGAQSPVRPYWVLMTRDVLDGSRSKKYAYQKALVASRARDTGLLYVLPGVLEAATAILSHYVRSGERLYADAPWTYTRCREVVDSQYPSVSGGFVSGGLDVNCSSHVHYCDGVAALRRL
ncbi:MAG: hypothetical protein MUC61_02210 [Amoebophilaceae bacterium]|nr:hypothetical protein [Amoebophilaceae bacterium]